MIYFDHAATCPMSEKALETMTALLREGYGNPSSPHRLGREAKNALEGARLEVAQLFGLSMKNVIFTGSGTEADNIAIMSAYKNRKKSSGHMITTAMEHEAVLKCAEALEEKGVEVTYITPNKNGVVDAEDVLAAVREDTFLVSVMAVNNEVGTVQPLKEISKGLDADVHFHVDAVQAAGHRPKDTYAFAHTVAMSGHKFYGPKGVGILLTRKELEPVTYGGGQERGIRSGTENVPAICAMAEALKEAEAHREEDVATWTSCPAACGKAWKKFKAWRLPSPPPTAASFTPWWKAWTGTSSCINWTAGASPYREAAPVRPAPPRRAMSFAPWAWIRKTGRPCACPWAGKIPRTKWKPF